MIRNYNCAAFMEWYDLEKEVSNWGKEYLPGLEVSTERDQDDWNIVLHAGEESESYSQAELAELVLALPLTPKNKGLEALEDLFEFDSDGNFVYGEFSTDISNNIASDFLGFRVADSCACYNGVYFLGEEVNS